MIRGVPVLGTLEELEAVVTDLRQQDTAPQRLVITQQSIGGAVVRDLLESGGQPRSCRWQDTEDGVSGRR